MKFIKVDSLPERIAVHADTKKKFEDHVARFCYSAAMLPDQQIEAVLEILEACAESDTMPLKSASLTATLQ